MGLHGSATTGAVAPETGVMHKLFAIVSHLPSFDLFPISPSLTTAGILSRIS